MLSSRFSFGGSQEKKHFGLKRKPVLVHMNLSCAFQNCSLTIWLLLKYLRRTIRSNHRTEKCHFAISQGNASERASIFDSGFTSFSASYYYCIILEPLGDYLPTYSLIRLLLNCAVFWLHKPGFCSWFWFSTNTSASGAPLFGRGGVYVKGSHLYPDRTRHG